MLAIPQTARPIPQNSPECLRKCRLMDETSPVDACMRDSLRREGLLSSGKNQEAALGSGLPRVAVVWGGPQEGIFFEPVATCKS